MTLVEFIHTHFTVINNNNEKQKNDGNKLDMKRSAYYSLRDGSVRARDVNEDERAGWVL